MSYQPYLDGFVMFSYNIEAVWLDCVEVQHGNGQQTCQTSQKYMLKKSWSGGDHVRTLYRADL